MQLGACAASRATALHELRAALNKYVYLPNGVSSRSAVLCCIQHSSRHACRMG